MHLHQTKLAYLFRRYFDKEATEEEKQELMTLISQDENMAEVKTLMNEAWEEYNANKPFFSPDQSEEMLRHILQKGAHTPEKKSPDHKHIFIRRLRIAAAAIVIGIMAWAGAYYYNRQRPDPTEWQAADPIKVDNNTNRIYVVVLPDSSKIWLSPHSSIEYPQTFIRSERRVELKGEAFFEINQDPSRPFIVVGGGMITRVLGTSFLLKAYPGKAAEIAVITGKVAVSALHKKENKVTLVSNQKAVLDIDRGLIKETKADNAVVQHWQKVNLFFDNIPFGQVIQVLNKKFDIRIHCREEEIIHYKLNADFNNQNLTYILEILEKSLNIRYEMINDSTINFYKDGNVSLPKK